MALLARCFPIVVVGVLGLQTGTVSAVLDGTSGDTVVAQWPASTVPWYKMPAVEAQLRGHYDVSFPVEATVCPPNTNPCINANGDQVTCCPGRCGAENDPIATCHVIRSRKVLSSRSFPVNTCPPEAQNPCYNPDGKALVCCPGSCGVSVGNSATCTGHLASVTVINPLVVVIYPPGTATDSPAIATNLPVSDTIPPVTATEPPVTATGLQDTTTGFRPVTQAHFASSSMHTGATCSPRAPKLCSTADSKIPVCCPGACGPVTGSVVTCAPVTPSLTPTDGTFSSPETKLPVPPTGYAWVPNPTLSDDFTGSSLDLTKWQPRHPYWSGRPPSRYDPANVAVGGGYAMLTTTTKITNVKDVANPLTDPWISSACIASVDSSAGFGFYEVRMKASKLNMTSAFWLQSENYEIDVVETIGSPDIPWRSTKMNINTHYFQNGLSSPSSVDIFKSYDWILPPYPTYTSGDFHTYSVWFKDAENLLFYFDGQLVWQMTPPANFTDQMYLFLDTEVDTKEGLPTVAGLTNSSKNVFYIDYVRAFTLQPAR